MCVCVYNNLIEQFTVIFQFKTDHTTEKLFNIYTEGMFISRFFSYTIASKINVTPPKNVYLPISNYTRFQP